MGDDEDLDLLALQRQLDDAFETTRPRRDFEDELWLRLQSRRPFWRRMQDGWAGLLDGVREAPAVPSAAVAVLVILVIGVGVLSQSGLGAHESATSSALSSRPQTGAAPNALAGAPFGRLPSVALYPGTPYPLGAGSPLPNDVSQPRASPIPANLYFGPATLSWTGQLPDSLGSALVYRYNEPTTKQADQFAASLSAAPSKQAGFSGPGFVGSYDGQGFKLSVRLSWSTPPSEPRFVIIPTATLSPGSDLQAVATAYLATHNLLPTWSNTVAVVPFTDAYSPGSFVRVQYMREFQLPNGSVAYLVASLGDRYGTEVVFQNGRTVVADGPIPLNLDSENYPLITPSRAVEQALASSPSGPQVISPQPVVQLDKVELVYALAVSGGQGFYEPAYLFSGSFQYQGQTLVKRVLVPAVSQP